jgi:Outer membrane receptor proteins, mostly Fe transport
LLLKNRLTTNIFFKNFNQKVVLNEPIYNTTTNLYEKQKYTQHKNAIGYGAAFSYKLLKNLHLMANAEKAVRLPNERELFGNIANDIVASPTLKPEISLNYNLGVDYRFNINNHYFNINTYVFYRDTKDMIKEVFSAREEYSSYTNLQSIETKGIDADITYSHKNLFMSFNISKLSSLFNTKYDEKGHKYNYYRTQIPNEPSLKFNYNVSYNFSDFIQKNSNSQIYCNLGYVKEFLRNWQNVGSYNLKYIPTQYPIDLGFSYTFPDSKLILNLSAKNILNQQIYDNYGLQKQGRSIFCKVTYSIL